ncbi:MAG: hypothetical protein QN163_10825 [Armatimonadota bacterium]|nr:hypothetical protein [Armatimonadota bacterium]MDR5696542.1 hypothetical protein [Armatimonadota bacterium]
MAIGHGHFVFGGARAGRRCGGPEAVRRVMGFDESGLALVVTLAATVVLLAVSATLVAVARNEYRLAALAQTSRQALAVAEAGLERGLFELRRDSNWTDATGATALSSGPSWSPLCLAPDAAPPCDEARAVDVPFPGTDPLGTFTVELAKIGADPPLGCDATTCMRLRASGRVRGSARVVQAVARRVADAAVEVQEWREVWKAE